MNHKEFIFGPLYQVEQGYRTSSLRLGRSNYKCNIYSHSLNKILKMAFFFFCNVHACQEAVRKVQNPISHLFSSMRSICTGVGS